MSTATNPPRERAVARDVRVDRIGFVEHLGKLWTDPLKKVLKETMKSKELDGVEGDVFEGKLFPSTTTEIDAKAFFKLYKKGEIKEAEFLSAIKVNKTAAALFLSPRDLTDISESSQGEPRLTIVRRSGIDITLAQVIAGIVEAAPLNAA